MQLATLAPPGGVVLDPFTGSGSTLIAARRAGRIGVGVELSATHVATAAKRVREDAEDMRLDFGDAVDPSSSGESLSPAVDVSIPEVGAA